MQEKVTGNIHDIENSEEEKFFLKQYDSSKYEKPSVTADILVFTIDKGNKLNLLLIKRGGYPFKGKWAIPGGFVNTDESLDEAAARELCEETNLENIYMEQLYTFGGVKRDPRMRVITVAYMALVPKESLQIKAGDDASDTKMFEVSMDSDGIRLVAQEEGREVLLAEKDLAFDHNDVIRMGIERLRGKLEYTNIAFDLLKSRSSFTVYELQRIYESILGEKLSTPNFRRGFIKRYVKRGLVEELEEKSREHSRRASALYKMKEER